jgi:hypothetical protein
MTLTIKTTILTGTQVFETYEEFMAFRSTMSAFTALEEPFALFDGATPSINAYYSQIPGGWELNRMYSDDVAFYATHDLLFGSTSEYANVLSDAKQAMSLLGWTYTREDIIN